MSAWQPIESAPKDATSVIVCAVGDGRQVVGEAYYRDEHPERGWWWANMSWGDYHADTLEAGGFVVTHWQPLPEPPTKEGETQP